MPELSIMVDDIINNNYKLSQISGLAITLKNIDNITAISEILPKIHCIGIKAFERRYFVEAVFILAFCYNAEFKREETFKFIMDNYYLPFKETFENTYAKNIAAFKNYEHIQRKAFPLFSDLNNLFIPMNLVFAKFSDGCMKYDKKQDKFEFVPSYAININAAFDKKIDMVGQRHMIYNVYDINLITFVHDKTHNKSLIYLKVPNYIYYDFFEEFVEYLQISDFVKCLDTKRAVFIFGLEELEAYMLKPETLINGGIFSQSNEQSQKFLNMLEPIVNKRNQQFLETRQSIEEYYSKLTPEMIREKIRNKTVRFALIVTKMSTAIQYFIRDCNEALQKMSINSAVYSEKNDLCGILGVNAYECADFINSFKPDIILIIGHFRWIMDVIPKQPVFICWVQDPLSHIMDSASAAKITDLDFILGMCIKYSRFRKIGYPDKQMIYGVTAPANPAIYKKYELTEKEKEEYSADICLVSNSGSAEYTMNSAIFARYDGRPDQKFVNLVKNTYREIYNIAFSDIYHERKNYFVHETEKLFQEFFVTRTGLVATIEQSNQMAFEFWSTVIAPMHKDAALLWLHEKGYNMKLWGRAWPNHPILKKYAMGMAQNGEILSKILNATKISLGLNAVSTFHPRIMESLFSHCMYIGNDVFPQSEDWVIARDFLVPGKEIVLYKNRKDLYKKIDYYLSNREERERMIEVGRKKALETLTYEVLMKTVLDKVENRLAEISGSEAIK